MDDRSGMLIDLSKCMGCRGCQVACKQWNQLPAEKTKFTGSYQNPPDLSSATWTMVQFVEVADPHHKEGTQDGMKWLFRKRSCLHCGEATCEQVCPTGAARTNDQGVVAIDQNICAGCKYCIESCPFGVPKADHEAGTAIKCRMCADRLADDLEPACAKACPTGAISFGRRDELVRTGRGRLAALKKVRPDARLYGDTELGGMGIMYLLPEKASVFGLPENPRVPHFRILRKWLWGLIPGAALLLWIGRFFMKDEKAAETGAERG